MLDALHYRMSCIICATLMFYLIMATQPRLLVIFPSVAENYKIWWEIRPTLQNIVGL